MNSYRIKNILVPVDLSESSLNALDTAVVIAKKYRADIYLLNIEESNFGYDDSHSPFFPNSSNASDVLTALAGAIQHTHGIQPKLLQHEGNVGDTIIKVALLYQADLIVMGSHGASGYRDGFIGSNTYTIIKAAACPVLALPVNKKYMAFRKVVFPIRPVSGGLMRYDIVRRFITANSTLDILGLSYRLTETDTGILKKIVNEVEHLLEKDKITTTVSWGEGNSIADDVIKYAQHNNADLLVVTSAVDVSSKPKFVGPHTQKIINTAKTAILCIKKLNVAMLA